MDTLLTGFNLSMVQLQTVVLILTALLHIICATAVAKDIGQLHKRHVPTQLMPGSGWVLAALLLGVLGLVAYWLVHHSSLAR